MLSQLSRFSQAFDMRGNVSARTWQGKLAHNCGMHDRFCFPGVADTGFLPPKQNGVGRGHGCECSVRNNIHYKDGKQTAATIPLRTTLSPVLPQFASFSKDRETTITTLLHAQHITRQQPLQHLFVCWSKNNNSDFEGPRA